MVKKVIFILAVLLFGAIPVSFAQKEAVETAEPEQAPAEIPVAPDTIVWIEDSLPEGATTTGDWIWMQDIKFSGDSCHIDGIKNGLHFHSFKVPVAVELKDDSVIEQFVYLDPDNPPRGIMLKFITLNGKDVDLYWEAEEEVFVDTVEYMEAWYMGFLPEPGSWQKLVIKMHELEIAPLELIGISFISYNGRTYWDRTLIVNPSSE